MAQSLQVVCQVARAHGVGAQFQREERVFWLAVIVAVGLGLFLWVPTIKRRMVLEQALLFGREFYGVELRPVVEPIRPFVLRQMKQSKATTPQATFFMLAPSVWDHLDGLKRSEITDGFFLMKLRNAISEEVGHIFEQTIYESFGEQDTA